MPATNLLYVTKDNVFDCYDKITGYVKKKYSVTATAIPPITETIAAGTILVVPSHSAGDTHNIKFNGVWMSVSDYAALILGQITQAARVSKIVYLVCSAEATLNPGLAALQGKTLVAPNGLLTYSVSPSPLLTVEGNAGLSPNDVIKLAQTARGYIVH